jgi:hypothetical protein
MDGEIGARDLKASRVAAYKTVLRDVLDQRPSGTRQRLATALGKNRSFVSQISNPAYSVPIPAKHLDAIFEICHFPPVEKRAFLEAYGRAHPRPLRVAHTEVRRRVVALELPDLGSARMNREFDDLMRDVVRRLVRLVRGAE